MNFVALLEQDTWQRESWTDRGEVADALAAFEGWHPQISAILGAVDETFIWALFDRAPLEGWSAGPSRRCSATRATRCSRSWRRAQRRRSRTAPR